MKAAVDLHIHTALSPCAEDDMTPNNIVNMALLKGLDAIAITDHNSAENCRAVCKCAEGKDIIVVPGMEVETREEVHVLCYFPDVDAALRMQQFVYDALPPIENRADIFGQQIIMDENDRLKGHVKQLLVTAADIGIEEVFSLVRSLGGAAVPAHIDRESYSIISNLGIIPDELGIRTLEITPFCSTESLTARNINVTKYKFVRSSDAHALGSILERESFLDIGSLSIEGIIKALG